MFCAALTERGKLSFPLNIFKSLTKDKYELKTVPVYRGAPFYLLKITLYRGQEPGGEEIVRLVGKCSKKLLAGGIPLPQIKEIGFFNGDLLYRRLIENTFLEILKRNFNRREPYDLAIVDTDGRCTSFSLSCAPFCKSMTVITKRKEEYYLTVEEIKNRTGLCPSVQESAAFKSVTADLSGCELTVRGRGEPIIFKNGIGFEPAEVYSQLVPEGIDRFNFYSALYELCGVFELGNGIFTEIEANGKKMTVTDIGFS